jgi:hypothetical protein
MYRVVDHLSSPICLFVNLKRHKAIPRKWLGAISTMFHLHFDHVSKLTEQRVYVFHVEKHRHVANEQDVVRITESPPMPNCSMSLQDPSNKPSKTFRCRMRLFALRATACYVIVIDFCGAVQYDPSLRDGERKNRRITILLHRAII